MTIATAVVIGGGVYGVSIATYLREKRGVARVLLFEQEKELFRRSSYVNQARVHNGYHYPRSFTTAYRSRINLPQFVKDYGDCVQTDFTKIYAIARLNSKVTARQFERFCHEIGAELTPAEPEHAALFDPKLIARAYYAKEYGFNTVLLGRMLKAAADAAGVEIRTEALVRDVAADPAGVTVRGTRAGAPFEERADIVFNCTYSGLQKGAGLGAGNAFGLKHEIAEMALVELPPALEGLGVTVMDGPFFSFMPFPDRGLHTLSHVRYTPHLFWQEDGGRSPYHVLEQYRRESRGNRMIRDAARYMPALGKAIQRDTLFEVKTVPAYTEGNDGRPILMTRDPVHRRIISILGGKIDNIYDILERLDGENLVDGTQGAA